MRTFSWQIWTGFWTSQKCVPTQSNKYQREMILLKLHHTDFTTLLPSGINSLSGTHTGDQTGVSSQVERSSTRLRCPYMILVFRAPCLVMSINPSCDTVPHTYSDAGRRSPILSAPSHLMTSAWAVRPHYFNKKNQINDKKKTILKLKKSN